jgi:hypothetical protein
MSANKLRRAGAPAFPGKKPELRLVKTPDERPRLTPDPEMKEILDDMRRRSCIQRERAERDPGGKDAA